VVGDLKRQGCDLFDALERGGGVPADARTGGEYCYRNQTRQETFCPLRR
jgi:hypothetical protein